MSIVNAIVFGATTSALKIYEEIEKKYRIVAFCDNDCSKWGEDINDIRIISPQKILDVEFDEIIIISISALDVIKKQLLDMGVDRRKINTSYAELKVRAREAFVKDFSEIVSIYNIAGNVAEAGVFQGEFAKIINASFGDRKFYLFDTFEGFSELDIEYEKKNGYSDAEKGHLSITSEELVLSKMPYRENCVIKKGYFPDTAIGINDTFCFVSVDMDLYKPTYEALMFFWPRLEKGGCILLHDFFSEGYEGINAAVSEFCELYPEVIPLPIGDSLSIVIKK